MRLFRLTVLTTLAFGWVACSSDGSTTDPNNTIDTVSDGQAADSLTENGCNTHAECTSDANPFCDPITKDCSIAPRGGAIGWGNGSVDSVIWTKIHTSPVQREATGLAFHPDRPDELWVINRPYESDASCDEMTATSEGCAALEGSVTIIKKPGQADSTFDRKTDQNAWHFMRRPTGIAFGVNDTFATCAEARTGNYLDDFADYVGPTLWSSDPAIFAQDPGAGLNGSHLDMLHATPWCMGIAHEAENIYWVFNGNIGSLDRYDFQQDHGPGHDNHDDGKIYRYVEGKLKRLPNVPSHMIYVASEQQLYVADTGNSRIVRLDTKSGRVDGEASPIYEIYAENKQFEDAELQEIIAPGTLQQPSGLAYDGDVLYITDHATGMFYAFTADGEQLRSLQSNLPANALAGLTIGPDGKIYFVDQQTADVYRLDPK